MKCLLNDYSHLVRDFVWTLRNIFEKFFSLLCEPGVIFCKWIPNNEQDQPVSISYNFIFTGWPCSISFCRLEGTTSKRPRPRSKLSLLSRLWPKLLTKGCSAGWLWGSIRRWTRPRDREPPSLASLTSLDLRSLRWAVQGLTDWQLCMIYPVLWARSWNKSVFVIIDNKQLLDYVKEKYIFLLIE